MTQPRVWIMVESTVPRATRVILVYHKPNQKSWYVIGHAPMCILGQLLSRVISISFFNPKYSFFEIQNQIVDLLFTFCDPISRDFSSHTYLY